MVSLSRVRMGPILDVSSGGPSDPRSALAPGTGWRVGVAMYTDQAALIDEVMGPRVGAKSYPPGICHRMAG